MEVTDVKRVGRFIAYKVDVKTGHWKRWHDKPEYRKMWVISIGGHKQAFPVKINRSTRLASSFMEESVENFERDGWWRLPKEVDRDRCTRIRKSKLNITFNEAVQGFLNLIEGEPHDKYRADWFERTLGMQRSSLC